MADTCLDGVLATTINANCPNPFQGFEDTAYIFNKSQIGTLTFDRGTGIVSGFIMADSGKKGYAVKDDSDKPFGSLKVTGEKKPYMIVFNKEMKLALIGNGATVISQVNTLTKGEYVMLVKQIGVDTQDGKYLLVGVESPLRFDASTFEASSDIFGHEVTLKEINARSVGFYIKAASAELTESLVAALLD